MAGPYIPHYFGAAVIEKLKSRAGWLTAGVATSIPWPPADVGVTYDGDDYILRGTTLNGKPSPPGITIACTRDTVDETISKVYRFTSILGWYQGGFVDVSGYVHGSHAILYGDPQNVFSNVRTINAKSFNCNHMPVINNDSTRKALAFYREGSRLKHVHDNYSFLSFHKVIESQFSDGKTKGQWINDNLGNLTDERATERISELRARGINVGKHLYDSGRCAVAHASLNGEIVDPDLPADRRRISNDLCIMESLARFYISHELHVENGREVYASRNRLQPWLDLIDKDALEILGAGRLPAHLSGLDGHQVSVGLWMEGPIPGLESLTMQVSALGNGIARIILFNNRQTIALSFVIDFSQGKIHPELEEGGLLENQEHNPNEDDVRAYATFFYKTLGNALVELTISGREPVDCEIVIPVNIIPPNPEEAINEQIEKFRKTQLL
ncbi:methylamine utilization protein MauJ [Burkholderia glumae]|uniref:methylamine utilization protein MauJ n=2 Tax=Burkholderia glumae TaxID=337 RepID=UPI0021502265|nr:methylamine utilization protein MauJ [Burkholderia glumae]